MNKDFLVTGAKALVPYELRPIENPAAWGKPLLTGRQFLALGSASLLALASGLLLYYSVSILPSFNVPSLIPLDQFYVAFILSSVETFDPLPPKSTEKRIAGSYRRTMGHMRSIVGLGHFIGGVKTYIWTALLAYLARQALAAWVFSPTDKDTSILRGSEIISAFILEPFNIVFTHKILTASHFSSIGTLARLLKTQELYTTLVYIGSIRLVLTSFQKALMVSDRTEHYERPFLTFSIYIILLLLRIALITRAHASLLPADAITTVNMSQPPQYRIGYRLWQILIRTLWMFKLLIVCALLGAIHIAVTAAALLYASGQFEKVLAWATASKETASPPAARDPHFGMGMGYDPEHDPHHRH
jgi:hypothetical protein